MTTLSSSIVRTISLFSHPLTIPHTKNHRYTMNFSRTRVNSLHASVSERRVLSIQLCTQELFRQQPQQPLCSLVQNSGREERDYENFSLNFRVVFFLYIYFFKLPWHQRLFRYWICLSK